MLLRKLSCLYTCMLLLSVAPLFSQVKNIQAVKVNLPPIIDGNLDEAVWTDIPIASDFIQNFPTYGSPASQRTEVKVIYDNNAIYIGAYLYDDPYLIRTQITARDEEQFKDLDFFSVFFDTYNDHQNGYQFLVSSSNVQTDSRLSPYLDASFGEYGDKTWDAVWDSKVSIKKDGWVVEMKIPYLSLRFSKSDLQDWGVQFLRSVRRTNEVTFWNPVDPQVNGLVNQFGLLKDIRDIKPPLRLSFSPYLSTGARHVPEKEGYRTEWLKSGGMDVKYGINESFTLDATLIPDFGQVISDNVINNLTPYEVRFDENRPFFTEGTDIFNKSGLFYSRRIGATPSGYQDIQDKEGSDPNIEVVRNPARTQLYNAIKFSGRTEDKLGIGIFNAVSAPMYATIRDKTTGAETKIKTESLTNYNIFVLDQALKGRSYVTLTNTNVIRNGGGRDANVTGVNFSVYDKTNTYNIKGFLDYSKVFTTDAYDGYSSSLRFGKVSGKIQYTFQTLARSTHYDPTDLGYLLTANQVINTAELSYNQFQPTKTFINYRYSLSVLERQLYQNANFNDLTFQASGYWLFKNFWDVTLTAGYLPDQHDYFVLGKPFEKYARRPEYGFLQLEGSTDSRKRLFFSYNALVSDFFKNPEKNYYLLGAGVRYRFSDKLTLDLSSRYEAETDYIVSAGRDAMDEPKIAFVDFKEVTSILSGIYNFTPRINLTLRVRHYWSNVPVNRIAHLDDKGYPVSPTPVSGVTDNVNYFNTDAFFTWDFRYGSRFIIGYKSWLGDDESVDPAIYKNYFSNLAQSFSLRHGHELTVRFIYFLDYNQFRKMN